jgi:hypothetical protein
MGYTAVMPYSAHSLVSALVICKIMPLDVTYPTIFFNPAMEEIEPALMILP